MRVRIDIALDLDGVHTFQWAPSDNPNAVEVPRTTLDRWTAEREAFRLAHLRWKRVSEEVEDTLYRAEHERARPEVTALASAVAASKAGRKR